MWHHRLSATLLSNITIVLHCRLGCLTRPLQRLKTNFLHIITRANHATRCVSNTAIFQSSACTQRRNEKNSNKVRQLGFLPVPARISGRAAERRADTQMLVGADTIRETRKSGVKSKPLSYFEPRRHRRRCCCGRGAPSYRDRRPCCPMTTREL